MAPASWQRLICVAVIAGVLLGAICIWQQDPDRAPADSQQSDAGILPGNVSTAISLQLLSAPSHQSDSRILSGNVPSVISFQLPSSPSHQYQRDSLTLSSNVSNANSLEWPWDIDRSKPYPYANGEGCHKNIDCQTGWCGGTLASFWPFQGTCADKSQCGATCKYNSECLTGWCTERANLLGQARGVCGRKKEDGETVNCDDSPIYHPTSFKCDYNECKAGNGQCGVCGLKVPDGSTCSESTDCLSGFCRNFHHLPPGRICGGTCVNIKDDGEQVPMASYPFLYQGTISRYDYAECKSQRGVCGTCGVKVPLGSKCVEDDDCQDGCCQGATLRTVTVDCHGTCVKKTPDACPNLFSFDGALATIQDGANVVEHVVDNLATCMSGHDMPTTPPSGQDLGCSMDGSGWSNLLLKVACEQLKPQSTLRLPAPQVLATNTETDALSDARRLFSIGYGNASAPKNSTIGCGETTSCKAGAEIDYFAELDLEPKFSFEANVKELEVKIGLDGTIKGSAGIAVSVGGGCSESKSMAYPAEPKPVATFCLGPVCIVVAMQVRLDLEMEGKLSARASAEYHTVYTVTGDATLSLNPDKRNDQAKGVNFNVARASEYWKLGAAGNVDGTITAKLGPVITVMVVPGAFVTVFPYVIGELSVYGEFDYFVQGGERTDEIPVVNWPAEIQCAAANIRRRRVPASSGTATAAPKSSRSESSRKKMTSSASTNGTKTGGNGFSVPVDVADDGKNCVAVGFALIPGIEVTGIGPPKNFDPSSMLDSVCDKMQLSLGSFGSEALDCFVPGGVAAICQKISDSLHLDKLKEYETKFVDQQMNCVDVWSDYIGCKACKCRVGCNRRATDDDYAKCVEDNGNETCYDMYQDNQSPVGTDCPVQDSLAFLSFNTAPQRANHRDEPQHVEGEEFEDQSIMKAEMLGAYLAGVNDADDYVVNRPDGDVCNWNTDCASFWCDYHVCRPKVSKGQAAAGSAPWWNYNNCIDGDGICGVCGSPVVDGSKCTWDSDCETGSFCSGYGSCAGTCMRKKADGELVSCSENPIGVTALEADCNYESQCQSGHGACGICGGVNAPDGSPCESPDGCSSNICIAMPNSDTSLCTGLCWNSEPPTQPPTQGPTQAPTQMPAEMPTQLPTHSPTQLPVMPFEACRACETMCAPCAACSDSREGECRKCWQCWDWDDDERGDDELGDEDDNDDDDDCNAVHKDHDWDNSEVRCLSMMRTKTGTDCRACWTGAFVATV